MPRMSEKERMAAVGRISEKLGDAVDELHDLIDDFDCGEGGPGTSVYHVKHLVVGISAVSMILGERLGLTPNKLWRLAMQKRLGITKQSVEAIVEARSRGDEPS